MRLIFALLLLAGCSQAEEAGKTPGAEQIDCIVEGRLGKSRCTLERKVISGNKLSLVVHEPDGGFRRFVFHGGSKLDFSTADGFEEVTAELADRGLPIVYLRVGENRYDIPVVLDAAR
jgi:hypothetical protein